MQLSISLIAEGWVVMADNETGSANLCIPVRPNERTLAFITVDQFDNVADARLAAVAYVTNGVSAADYIASLEEEEDEATVPQPAQLTAVPATSG